MTVLVAAGVDTPTLASWVGVDAPFRPADSVELESVTLGWRPLPIDGHPVIGFPKSAPGDYLMVTHSGFTLAAILAQFAAIEILNGAEVDMLAPFRVERFQ